MPLPSDYAERVYAGVLGKIIGVYLGRPFEGWDHERILRELGEIRGYVHDKLNVPLIVTDDDITGTFTFVRAMEDFIGAGKNLSAAQIGQTWLNYIIENKTILWWGGMGLSTEHTAFLRLLAGVEPPRSGSIEMNGKVVAEQIGAQIFIDAWAMIAPGDPNLAAELARRAASVSHDGEAVYAAQVIAAMESQAFIERDISKLLDVGLSYIPKDCVIRRLIDDLVIERSKHDDWKKAFADVLKKNYGYDRYGGNCHVVPNHGVVILSLLFGRDDFSESLMIANTAGWDTDCNSANVGCLMGIKNGLGGIDAKWREPVADCLYLPTADGGSAISDAVREADRIIRIGTNLADESYVPPKDGARFHFSYPGSVQGFMSSGPDVQIDNIDGRLRIRTTRPIARVATPTFIPPDAMKMPGYALLACPTLYSGQTVRAVVSGPAKLFAIVYQSDELQFVEGRLTFDNRGGEIVWKVPDTGGRPIAHIGVEVHSGTTFVDRISWDGEPNIILRRLPGTMWQRAWIEALDAPPNNWDPNENFRLIQNRGRGLLIHGTRDWRNVRIATEIWPHMAAGFGLAIRVQGLRRYYALLATRDNKLRLIKRIDGKETILAEATSRWQFGKPYVMTLSANGNKIVGAMDVACVVSAEDSSLDCGAIALVCEEGRIASGPVQVTSVAT